MKTFFRILSHGRPFTQFAVPFLIFSTLSTIFGLLNFSLLIPLLDVLFGRIEPAQLQTMQQPPAFSWSLDYVTNSFYHFFSEVVRDYGKMGALQFVCLTIVTSVLLANVFSYLSMRINEKLKIRTIKSVRKQLFERITALPLGYFSNQRKGDLTSRVATDATELEYSISISLSLLFREPISLICFFIALFSISVKLTLFTLIIVPISGSLIAYLTKKMREKTKLGQEYIGSLISIVDETIGAMRIITGFNAQGYIRQKFENENERYARQLNSIARTRELVAPFSEFSGVLVVSIILLYGGSLVFSQDASLSASQFVAYIILFSQVLRPAKAISKGISDIQKGLSAADRIFEVIDTPSEINDTPQAKKMLGFEKRIEFRDVWFKYQEQWILKGVSFTIEKGEKVALVGETGSGKSTISDLIPRFYDIQKGEILIDDVPLQAIEMHSLRAQMGIVTQEAILFNDTIANNIAFAEEVSQEEIQEAAKIANAHDFILKTEKQYQSNVGDRGMKLSGGQRQRMTIARAVLKNPPILILDEATSALDVESEKLVQDALYKLMKNRTSLVIAHRLSTIQDADKILVLKNGEIIEQGTHETLLAQENGYYKRMTAVQIS